MIEFAEIYKGIGLQPNEKLKTILNQIVRFATDELLICELKGIEEC